MEVLHLFVKRGGVEVLGMVRHPETRNLEIPSCLISKDGVVFVAPQ